MNDITRQDPSPQKLPGLQHLHVLGIGGSLRPGSFSYTALEYAIELLRESGADAEILDLRLVRLPFCNGDKHDLFPDFPAVARLRRVVRQANALILATPEYHGSISGVMKNVLDLLDFEHLEGKVVGGISVLGGQHNSNALNSLRTIMRWCHAWMIPEQIALGKARTVFVDGEIRDPELIQRFRAFITSLIRNTLRLNDYFLTSQAWDKNAMRALRDR